MPEIAIGRDHVGLFKIINQFRGAQRDRIKELILEYDIKSPEDLIYFPESKLRSKACGKVFVLRLKKSLIELGFQYDDETAEDLSRKIEENRVLISEPLTKLRFEVMQRDGFRCQYCGRNPQTDPTVELQVDHKHPQSKGGQTSKENLITACRECNVGKSDTLLSWGEINER